MKIGLKISIDVTKIDKSRIFAGKKGKYIDLTGFIDTDNPGQYGDHGTLSQSVTAEERQNGTKLPICGNAKVFWKDAAGTGDNRQEPPQQTGNGNYYAPQDDDDSNIPF